MKFAVIISVMFLSFSIKAQSLDDSTSMGALYANQVFYSFENGEILNITNEDWNIAFSLSGDGALGSSILINESTTNLWATPQDTSSWSMFDSTGHASWDELLNSDTSWTNGAFNTYRGSSGFFDLGWGILDPSNNYWTFGDSLYLIKLGNGAYKKLWIESLKTGVWAFRYADLDGSNESIISIDKANYSNKNFIYFSLETNTIIDREPDNSTWDIMFTKHRDEIVPGMIISVTSIFNNIGLWTASSNEMDYNSAINSTSPQSEFNQDVVNIGRTWKNFSAGSWTVYDSIAFFAWNVDSTDLYRIVFTDFGGMGTGKSYFNINKLATAGNVNFANKISCSVFPNPTTESIRVNFPNENNEQFLFKLYTINGELVINDLVYDQGKIDVNELPAGIYVYHVIGLTQSSSGKLIIR